MANMNLIPDDYRQEVHLRRMVRNFIVICVLILCCVGIARASLSYLIWRESALVVQLEQQEQVSQQNITATEQYRQKKLVTEQQLDALSKLRGGDLMTVFLVAIDNAHKEGIWFDSLRFIRRDNTNNHASPANAVQPATDLSQSLELDYGAEIIGHALNHSVLADFMRQLGAQQCFADLRLIDTATRNYTTNQVIDFNIDLQINKNMKKNNPVNIQGQS